MLGFGFSFFFFILLFFCLIPVLGLWRISALLHFQVQVDTDLM